MHLLIMQLSTAYHFLTPGVWPTMLQFVKRGANSLPLLPLTRHCQENSTVIVCRGWRYCLAYLPSIYRMSQEECARLREGVPYVKVYRYNPKHLRPKLNGYGDNGQRSMKL